MTLGVRWSSDAWAIPADAERRTPLDGFDCPRSRLLSRRSGSGCAYVRPSCCLIAFRDLQFRLRRFLISVVAVALVLALTMLLAGVAASFDHRGRQDDRTVPGRPLVRLERSQRPFPQRGAASGIRGRVGRRRRRRRASRAARFLQHHDREAGWTATDCAVRGRARQASGLLSQTTARRSTAPDRLSLTARSGCGSARRWISAASPSTWSAASTRRHFSAVSPTAFVAMDDLQQLAYTGAPVISAVAARGDPQGSRRGCRCRPTRTHVPICSVPSRPPRTPSPCSRCSCGSWPAASSGR